jgi:branched-chain amino acid transport system permease protein
VLSNQFFVSPTGGVSLSIYGYIAVVVGGWGSIFGAVAGAIIIALFQVVASAFVPYTVATGGLCVALLVILFFRPQGLFGERIQRRVSREARPRFSLGRSGGWATASTCRSRSAH